MPLWTVTLVLSIAATIWLYTRIAETNGNADPKKNIMSAGLAGIGIFIVIMVLIKFVLNWD
jgi:hypothetical protein